MTTLKWLEKWFKSNCGDDWEHDYINVKIETLDNPGWMVDFNLIGTPMEDKKFNEIHIDNGDNDWIFCYLEDDKFKGRGDTDKLEDILTIFKKWVEE